MKYAWLVLGAALATGCIESQQDFTVNPDGSGKVKVVSVFQPINFNLTGGEDGDPATQMKDSVRAELEKATGVEAWREVSYRRLGDGRVEFTGTAYFRELAKLRLHNAGFQNSLEPKWAPGADGLLVLELQEKEKPAKPAKASAPATTPEEIQQRITGDRAKFQQMRPMLLGVFTTLKVEMTFRLPGTVEKTTNFQKVDAGTVRLTLDGAKMLAAMDGIMADDVLLQQQIKAGRDFQQTGPEPLLLNEKLYGERGPVRVAFKPGSQPLFDFAAEAAAAKQAMPAMLKTLKLDALVSARPAAQAGTFKGLTVAGVQLVTVADQKRQINPFNRNAAGLAFSLVAELPAGVISVTKGEVTKAVTDTGEDLLPVKEWDRRVSFPRLTPDKSAVVFEVAVGVPGPQARGIQELAGTLEYFMATKTREVDLGIADFTAGAAGTEFGATIKSIKASEWQAGSTALALRLRVAKDTIKSVTFYDAAGAKLEAKQGGSMSSGNDVTLDFNRKGEYPAKGRIVVEVYDDGQTFRAPFELKNVSLLGQPK
ncbi:MAG: hypothetical protein PCFJNLEI_02888 [Verrucomicrobiae bacterium]|nr:hypothetical protein [Verrucomicrobiae bacterium]